MGLQRFQGQVNFFVFLRETKWFTKLQYQVAIHLGAVQKLRSVNFCRLTPHPPLVVPTQCFSFNPPTPPSTTQCFVAFFLFFTFGLLAQRKGKNKQEKLRVVIKTLRLEELKQGCKKVWLQKQTVKCRDVKRTHKYKNTRKIVTK